MASVAPQDDKAAAGTTTHDGQTTHPRNFILFPTLPPEIRRQIWKAASEEFREHVFEWRIFSGQYYHDGILFRYRELPGKARPDDPTPSCPIPGPDHPEILIEYTVRGDLVSDNELDDEDLERARFCGWGAYDIRQGLVHTDREARETILGLRKPVWMRFDLWATEVINELVPMEEPRHVSACPVRSGMYIDWVRDVNTLVQQEDGEMDVYICMDVLRHVRWARAIRRLKIRMDIICETRGKGEEGGGADTQGDGDRETVADLVRAIPFLVEERYVQWGHLGLNVAYGALREVDIHAVFSAEDAGVYHRLLRACGGVPVIRVVQVVLGERRDNPFATVPREILAALVAEGEEEEKVHGKELEKLSSSCLGRVWHFWASWGVQMMGVGEGVVVWYSFSLSS